MVIYNLDVVGISITPHEADAPLIVDANAVLSLSVALERFQMITRRGREVAQFCGNIQLPKLSLRHPFELSKPLDVVPCMQLLCLPRTEGLDHDQNYITLYVKRQPLSKGSHVRKPQRVSPGMHEEATRLLRERLLGHISE